MNIYTLTLNPAYDVHMFTARFAPYHENLARLLTRDAGGKGLNISRALQAAGIANTAVIVLGRENSEEYKTQVQAAGVTCLLLEKEGRIRENLTLHCENGPETRISLAGFSLEDNILQEILGQLSVDEQTVVTFTGRVPDGVSMASVKAFLQALKARGAKLVIDSRSFSLEDLYAVRPWLVKPNQEEISAFFGTAVETAEEAAQMAKALTDRGIENAMISLGELGAVLASGGSVYTAAAPRISVCSTVGAGDSAIAGFLAATAQGKPARECLAWAVAFGSAACMQSGSQPPDMEDVLRLL